MPKKQPYLKELKENDPERLRTLREKGYDVRRAKTEKMKNLRDIVKGYLSVCVVATDPNTGEIKKDNKGKPYFITKKELLAMKTIDKAIESGNVKDLIEIGELIGDIDKKQENNINLFFESIRREVLNDD